MLRRRLELCLRGPTTDMQQKGEVRDEYIMTTAREGKSYMMMHKLTIGNARIKSCMNDFMNKCTVQKICVSVSS